MKILISFLAITAAILPLRAELFIVRDDSATVYADGRSTGALAQGEIFAGNWVPGDEWVTIQRDDRTFRVRRQRLTSEAELDATAQKQRLELQAKAKQLRQDYALLLAERRQLANLAIETERDQGVIVVFPGVRITQVPTTTVINSRAGRTVQMVPRLVVQPEEVATLTERQARRVLKKINARRELIAAEITTLTDQLIAAEAEFVRATLAADRQRQRFERYKLFPNDYLRERFIVLVDRATVYRGVDTAGELQRQQVVSGTANPRDPEWITIDNFPGGAAKVRAKNLGAEPRLMAAATTEIQKLKLAVELTDHDIELELARKQALRAAVNDLDVLIERGHKFVQLDPDDIARRRDERVLPVPVGAVESANVQQAKKQIREFEDKLEELAPRLNQLRARLLELRQRLVDVEARKQKLVAAFAD